MDQFLVDLYDHMVSHSGPHKEGQGGMGWSVMLMVRLLMMGGAVVTIMCAQ